MRNSRGTEEAMGKLSKKTLTSLGIAVLGTGLIGAEPAKKPPQSFNDTIQAHARKMMSDGQKIFRFDTFGSEAFWGDTLHLHQAIAGEKNGGVGAGVSPKTA